MKGLLFLPAALLVSCNTLHPHSEEAHERKMVSLLEKFDRFDYNGNGKLTREEIIHGLKDLGSSGVTDEEIDALIRHADTNDDGSVSLLEAQRAEKRGIPQHH